MFKAPLKLVCLPIFVIVLPICCHVCSMFVAFVLNHHVRLLNLSMEKDGRGSKAWYLWFPHRHDIADQMFIPHSCAKRGSDGLTPLKMKSKWLVLYLSQNSASKISPLLCPHIFFVVSRYYAIPNRPGAMTTGGCSPRSWCCRWCSGSVAWRHSPSAHRGGCQCDASSLPRWSWPTTGWTAGYSWPGGPEKH